MNRIYLFFIASIFFVFSPIYAKAANLTISPIGGNYEVGERVVFNVNVSTNQQLNAVSGSVIIPAEYFTLESVAKNNSILNFWVTEPSFSRTSGIASFEGVALGGFKGSSGTVITIIAKAIKAGSGNINFQSGQVLANDGEGTDITGSKIGATFSIIESTQKKKAVVEEKPVEEKAPEKVPEKVTNSVIVLKPAEIVYGEKYGDPAIIGHSDYSKSQVLLTFTSQDGVKIFITGITDSDGSFTLLVPHSLKRGDYSVFAIIVKDDGTHTGNSNELTIKVGSIFSDLGFEVISFMVLLIIAIIYLIARTLHHFKRSRKLRSVIKKEVHEAQSVLHKSFNILRDDLIDDIQKKNQLDTKTKINEFKKDIDDAEEAIEKEIKDIELP